MCRKNYIESLNRRKYYEESIKIILYKHTISNVALLGPTIMKVIKITSAHIV